MLGSDPHTPETLMDFQADVFVWEIRVDTETAEEVDFGDGPGVAHVGAAWEYRR